MITIHFDHPIFFSSLNLDQLHVLDKEFRHLYQTINPESLTKHGNKKSVPISVDDLRA